MNITIAITRIIFSLALKNARCSGRYVSERVDAYKDNALRKKYSSALMSNHKWRKLFTVMAEHSSDFSGIEYHFTDTDNVFYGHAPSVQQLWETAIDDPGSNA